MGLDIIQWKSPGDGMYMVVAKFVELLNIDRNFEYDACDETINGETLLNYKKWSYGLWSQV